MKKKWIIKKHDHNAARTLSQLLGVKPLIAALLIDRGYSDEIAAERFLRPKVSEMHSPALLKDLHKAAERIRSAIANNEKLLIWGDYDVDGTTGTALLRRALKHLGAETEFHIPNRFTEGYGLNIQRLEKFKADGGKLVITVDCGIRSFEAASWLKQNKIDLIITDHHIPDADKGNPPALAVVNPNQQDCSYPDKDLAGVGVALKMALYLFENEKNDSTDIINSFFEIAAIGTIADVMNLSGENRIIVARGLKQLRLTNNFGLKAMMESADCRSDMTSNEIAYRIAPRINAAGRMDAAKQVVELLESDDFSKARKIADNLNKLNYERQKMQQTITDEAIEQSRSFKNKNFIVVAGENWHRGVIGLAASRLVEKLYRPVIVISHSNGIAHGSARSIPGFNILAALESASDHLQQFGGHFAAAGMTLKTDEISTLRKKLEQYADTIFKDDDPEPEILIDARLSSASITGEIIDEIKCLEPFGQGNKKPVFVTDGLYLRFDPMLIKNKHLKLYLGDNLGNRFEAVWWNGAEQTQGQTPRQGDSIEVAYRLELNDWQGNKKIQLVVEDIRPDNSRA